MHAAAVVIDVKTGEVRALASNPDFDVNELDERYSATGWRSAGGSASQSGDDGRV